jgi:HAD superfamily hydrolase (TIGR01509 family)
MQAQSSTYPQAVLLDLDGTLLDTEGQIAAALVETLAQAGYVVPLERVRAISGLPLRGWLVSSLGMAPIEAEAIYAAYLKRTLESYVPLARPMPYAQQLLHRLDERGVALAIVTTRMAVIATALLSAAGWSKRLPLVVAQETAAHPKPAPDPAEYALRALGVTPQQAVIVGNTEADMACGLGAGLAAVVGVVGERSAAALFAAGATHVCADLMEVGSLILGPDA